jgi:lipid A 4'-phosphatase
MSSNTLKSIFFRYDTIGFLTCVLLFIWWPQVDLYVSDWFYEPCSSSFYLKDNAVINSICTLTHVIAVTVIITLILMLIGSWSIKNNFFLSRKKVSVYLLSACVLSSGLIVNLVLKDNWERPRPRQSIEFGGERAFEPAFSPTFQCEKCYSFVSGHASVGFYFFAFALLSRNRRWLWLPVIAGGIIGTARISLGAHYLSDVVFSGWAMWFSTLFLYTLFFNQKENSRLQRLQQTSAYNPLNMLLTQLPITRSLLTKSDKN